MKSIKLLLKYGVLPIFIFSMLSFSASGQSFKWAKQGSSEGFEYGNAIVADDSGNVYVTGQLEFSANFDGVILNSNGKHDIMLAKYATDGTMKWVHHAGGLGGDVGWGIGLDSQRNIYYTGEFELTAGFEAGDSLTSSGSNDIYLSKYTNEGQFLWAKNFGGSGDDKGKAIVVDKNGNSYITGYFSSTGQFGSVNLVSSNSSNDIFIVKVNSEGTVLWATKAGGTREDRGRGIVLDGTGNLFITGTITQSATFNTTNVSVAGVNSLFVAKYDTNGVFQWVRASGGCCDTTRGNAISVDNSGNVYIAGYFMANTTIGGNSLTSFGAADIFVTKYDSNGNNLWVRQAGGPYEDMAYSCAYDKIKDQLYVTGQIDDHGYFGSIYVGAAGNRDVFVASYDPNGNEIFARPGGGNQRDAGQSITYDTLGNIYCAGFFTDTASFGPSTLTGYPLADFYIAKMAPPLASQPLSNATSLSASMVTCSGIELNFTSGDGARRIVIAKAGSPVNSLPVDGVFYNASSTIGQGSDVGSGNFVVYDGTGNSVVVDGTTSGVRYYFAVFEYNGVGYASNYLQPGFPTTNFLANNFIVNASSPQTNLCIGSSTSLSATSATSYSWSPSVGLSSTVDSMVTANPSSTTTYTITATNSGGCTATSSITINVHPIPIVTFSSLSPVCENSSPITLTNGSPAGGVYSGSGVTGNQFNPAINGPGNFTLNYFYSDVNNCSSNASASISVKAKPIVTIGSFSNVCSSVTNVNLTSGSPSGGIYSGNGVTANRFNPSVAGTGTQIIYYTYTATNGCSSTASATILVNPTPVVSQTSFSPACINSSPITLSGGSPIGGTYSGSQVVNGVFNPQTAGLGTFLITYSYTNGNGCLSSASSNITVSQLPSVSVSSINPLCSGTASFLLSSGSPTGGIYSGSGITNNYFDPSVVASGTSSYNYSFTNSNGCSASASGTITVKQSPSVSLSTFTPICENSSSLTLTGGSPLGGIYTGSGVNGNLFNPSLSGSGNIPITYSYTSTNGCSSTAQSAIAVNATPIISFAQLNSVCANTNSFLLTGGLPAGGNYTGQGVSADMFNASVNGPGTYTITYTFTSAQGCTNSANINQVVNAIPTVTFAPINPVCDNSAVINLIGGSPSGGTYSGNGVTGTTFDPAISGAGNTPIIYTYTSSAGCSADATTLLTVNPSPVVTLSTVGPFCSNGGNQTLNNGFPSGGTYTGTGISGTVFTPSTPGTFVESYLYVSANGCSSTAQFPIVVNATPVVTLNSFNSICVNATPIVLTGGQPLGGVYGGIGTNAGNFDPSVGAGLHVINYSFTNSSGCTASTTSNILVNPTPVVNLGADSVICSSASVVLNVGNSYSSVLWSNGSTANSTTVDSSGIGIGNKSVVVTVSNNAGCLAKDTIVITFDLCNGIMNHPSILGVYLYPNPFDGSFHILCEHPIDCKIFDVSGRLVESHKGIEGNFQSGEKLAPGTYFIEVTNGESIKIFQIIKTIGN